MSALTKLFGASLAAALVASVASAATITYSSPTDFASIPVTNTGNFSQSGFGPGGGPAGNGGGEELPFKQFDPAYGTLTGISITVTGLIGPNSNTGQTSIIAVQNTSPATQTFLESFSLQFYLMDNVPSCLHDVENNGTSEAASGCMLGSTALNFNDSDTLEPGDTATHTLNLSDSFSFTLGSGAFGAYTGTGTLPLQIFLESSNFFDNGNGTSVDTVRVFAGANASITYTYDEAQTPEPGSMFLMGGALLGVGLLRKRFAR